MFQPLFLSCIMSGASRGGRERGRGGGSIKREKRRKNLDGHDSLLYSLSLFLGQTSWLTDWLTARGRKRERRGYLAAGWGDDHRWAWEREERKKERKLAFVFISPWMMKGKRRRRRRRIGCCMIECKNKALMYSPLKWGTARILLTMLDCHNLHCCTNSIF